MLERFLAYIKKEQLFSPSNKILLSVSGGMDSVLMCYLFSKTGFYFGIAHCNYFLREKISEEENKFTNEISKFFDVPFYDTKFKTREIALERKQSIQEVARDLRYEWLEKIREENGYDYIATAHHLSDSIETFLFNFGRGGGIRALHGILPKVGKVIRPLLFLTKSEVEEYLTAYRIQWRHDASNDTDKYNRNKIRHHVVPVFKDIYPSFEEKAGETISHLREVEAIFDWSIRHFRSQLMQTNESNHRIDLKLLHSYPAPSTILYELMKDFNFHRNQITQILASQTGKQFYSNSHQAIIDRQALLIRPKPQKREVKYYDIDRFVSKFSFEEYQLHFEVLEQLPKVYSTDQNIAYLDYHQLQFPLRLRHWKKGDRFQPIGMQGKSKKLQDYFSDLKLNRFEKEAVWIVVSKGEIAWIIGHRLDERFKLKENSKKAVKITFITRGKDRFESPKNQM
ncbi:MAG: tRNA lysidine(34) synthetase TilS [Bacteroidota bacterium]